MWAVSPSSPPKLFIQFLIQNPTFNPRSHRLRSQLPGENAGDTIYDGTSVKALGLTILEATQSSDPKSTNANLNRRNRKQQDKDKEEKQQDKDKEEKLRKEEEEAEERQISGSDVLWALKKAATQRAKQQQQKTKKKKRGVSSSESFGTEDEEDIENLSPLRIKSDWGMRLNELEKRLQDISETI